MPPPSRPQPHFRRGCTENTGHPLSFPASELAFDIPGTSTSKT